MASAKEEQEEEEEKGRDTETKGKRGHIVRCTTYPYPEQVQDQFTSLSLYDTDNSPNVTHVTTSLSRQAQFIPSGTKLAQETPGQSFA